MNPYIFKFFMISTVALTIAAADATDVADTKQLALLQGSSGGQCKEITIESPGSDTWTYYGCFRDGVQVGDKYDTFAECVKYCQ